MICWKNGMKYELPDLTAEQLAQMEEDRINAQIAVASRPMTDSEILRLNMRSRVNSMSIDNAAAGRMMDCFPAMSEVCAEGELIRAGTRIRDEEDGGVLWRANVDLWNMPQNSPSAAKTLWECIRYRDGIRVAPEVFTSTNAAGMGEYMWFGSALWQSGMAGNVYHPAQAPAVWTFIKEA